MITGGAVFSEFFQKHKFMIVLASLMTIISSYFLLKDIISIFEDEDKPKQNAECVLFNNCSDISHINKE